MNGMRIVMTCAAMAALTAVAADQPSSALTVAGKATSIKGMPECTYTNGGSIYNVPASIWSVQQVLTNGSLNFTVFRPKQGGDMISLLVALDGKVHQVSTVKVAASGNVKGSGAIRLTALANGGHFAIDATASDGAQINGTIFCPRLAKPQDNG
jgi:hypothetical protein